MPGWFSIFMMSWLLQVPDRCLECSSWICMALSRKPRYAVIERIEPFSDIALFISFPHIYAATTWTNVYMIAAHHGTLIWFHSSSLLVKATYIIDSFTGCVMWLSVAFEKQWKFPPVTWAENLLQPRHSQPIFRPANHKRVCQPIGVDVLLYRTEGPSAPRLGLCSSLIFGWTAAN